MSNVTAWPTVLKAAGVKLDNVAGWEGRGRFPFVPVCIMWHHTAGGTDWKANLGLIIAGRDNIPGPLANSFISRDGVWHFVAAGRSNNAGLGNKYVVDNAVRGIAPARDATTPGTQTMNQYYFGIEVDNLGTGEPYPQVQIDTLVKGCAAILEYEKWHTAQCVHHRESTNRKIDMSYRGDLRKMVDAARQPVPPPLPERKKSMGALYKTKTAATVWVCSEAGRWELGSTSYIATLVKDGILQDEDIRTVSLAFIKQFPLIKSE